METKIRFSIRFRQSDQTSDEEFDESVLRRLRSDNKNLYENGLNFISFK